MAKSQERGSTFGMEAVDGSPTRRNLPEQANIRRPVFRQTHPPIRTYTAAGFVRSLHPVSRGLTVRVLSIRVNVGEVTRRLNCLLDQTEAAAT